MARTATMSTTEAERELGPRGHLQVSADNRLTVRKWLNAQGFPSLFSGGLSMKELAMAYNDQSGRALEGLKRKLEEAASIEGDEVPTAPAAPSRGDFAPANGGFSFDTKPATVTGQSLPAAIAGTTSTAPSSPTPAPSSPAPTPAAPAGAAPDMQRVIAAVMAAMAAMGPQGVDENEVRRIAEKCVADKSMTPEAIRALVAEEAPKHVTTTRIEIKSHDSDEVRTVEGHHHPMFPILLKAAASRQTDGHHPNIWIAGPAGSGKTYAAKMLAKAMGADFFYNGALSMPHELLGFIDAGGTYHETPFRQAYTRKAVYLFDEVDGSDNSALLALNAALANGCASFPNGQAHRHEDSIIVATANTWGLGATADYVGRAKIDAAFMSRFPVRISWDYDTDMEQQISGNVPWAQRVQKARAKARAAGIKVLIDPRASIAGAGLIAAGMTMDEAASFTYLANLTTEQRTMIEAR